MTIKNLENTLNKTYRTINDLEEQLCRLIEDERLQNDYPEFYEAEYNSLVSKQNAAYETRDALKELLKHSVAIQEFLNIK